MTTAPLPYLMESTREAERLEAKTDAEETRRQLRLVGLGTGMRALDAGAGTGAVARVMSELVGPAGMVVALDGSGPRLAHGRRLAEAAGLANIAFLEGDLEDEPRQPGAFDLVWCRFVLEYLAEPDRVLARLVRWARVGGKVVVGDVDGAVNFHHPIAPGLTVQMNQIVAALAGRYDPLAGRKLYRWMRDQGLGEVKAHVLPYHLYAGAAPPAHLQNWEEKFRTIRPAGVAALGGSAAYDRFVAEYLDHLRDPETFTYSTLILVEGIRVR
jgi:ubiquinone/menaquinone biosynthesis C-methylase UbiE